MYYLIPNLVLFGSIYIVAKYVESASQDWIDNYEQKQKQLNEFVKKFRG